MADTIQTLWPPMPSGAVPQIEVFGCCGEYRTGKTLLGLSIAPGVHPEGHPFAGKPRTLLLDMEKSAGTYAGTGAERIDVHKQLTEQYPQGYDSVKVFEWFQSLLQSIQPGQYDVIMMDTITDVETGLEEYVKRNYSKFGLSFSQIQKAGGLYWGKVKEAWKTLLLQLASKSQTFFFTAHLRNEYNGSVPTGKKEPKGKETLMELASLYLWLSRTHDKDGKERAVPSATVLKDRLADTSITANGEMAILPLLPPRLDVCSIAKIREYIAKGCNYDGTSKNLMVETDVVSDSEAARIQLAIEEKKAETAATQLAIEEQRRKIAECSQKNPLPITEERTFMPSDETTTPLPPIEPEPVQGMVSTPDTTPVERPGENLVSDSNIELPPEQSYHEMLKNMGKTNFAGYLKMREVLKSRGKRVCELTDEEAKSIYDHVMYGQDIPF